MYPEVDVATTHFLARMRKTFNERELSLYRADHEIIGELSPQGNFNVKYVMGDIELSYMPPWVPLMALAYTHVKLVVISDSPPPYTLDYTVVYHKGLSYGLFDGPTRFWKHNKFLLGPSYLVSDGIIENL